MTALGVAGGYSFQPPHPTARSCTRERHSSYVDWRGNASSKRWQCLRGRCSHAEFWLNLVAGGIPCWPPFHRMSRIRTLHCHLILNINAKYVALDNHSGWWLRAVIRPDFALGGRGYCWPPLPLTEWVVTHVTTAWHYLAWRGFIPMIMTTSKLNVKHNIWNFKDIFLGLLFAYTTSDVYLTLRFKFWNVSNKFLWNYYLSFMALYNQWYWWPVVPYNIVWFDYQIFAVHWQIFETYILTGNN
jgi:hypothetical protein